jgi:hypothetical protein
MRWPLGAALVAGLCTVGLLAGAGAAAAEVVVTINKSKQLLTVTVDGIEQHIWKVSTGLGGGPPSGTYKPERLERKWFSRKYGWSPMPHSIFFHKGYAIHGTIYVSRLGRPASHGCVRLHPTNAATLFNLVREHGMDSTTVAVGHTELALQHLLMPGKLPSKPEASAQRRMPQPPKGVATADAAPATTATVTTQAPAPAALDIEE